GQAVRVTLANPSETDSKGASRILSIASAPRDANLTLITRMRDSSFKRGLAALDAGAELTVSGPIGHFALHEDTSRPAVFLAGGIGITPFLSMIRNEAHKGFERKITLVYANSRPDDAACLGELQHLADIHPNFELVATMTAPKGSHWKGEIGRIDGSMLQRHVQDPNEPIYYCVGPANMVASTQDILSRLGITPQDVRVEQFAGY
ncbi:FAD-dependent oxidoreductase, partial [Tropicimonas sp. TH_r6]|uniref:FAD-dependent oxidoreductase n=1 Tax=Tropicimonas sp. TH_r6 TaxID=3082085 RepID=UPI002952C104